MGRVSLCYSVGVAAAAAAAGATVACSVVQIAAAAVGVAWPVVDSDLGETF